MTNGKYKSLVDFYKFGFGRYPGLTRSTNLVDGITDTRQLLCIPKIGSLVDMENTAAVHTYPSD
jgi:hypothetical protein